MKKINFAELKKLSIDNNHPLAPIVLTSVIQTYLGGLERVLQFLMVNVALLWLAATAAQIVFAQSFLTGLISIWVVSVLCASIFACLYIEYLYCSKGSSFFTTVTWLSRLLCPDKNADHRRVELSKSREEVEK